jgi:hypothetical protein
MNLNEELLIFHQSRDLKSLTKSLIDEPVKIEKLVNVISNLEEYPFKEMSSWILTHLAKSNPELVQPFYEKLVDILFKTDNQTVLRNCTNILYHLNPTDYKEGELIDQLIQFIQNNNNKVALQVYSIYFITHFVKKYPELFEEVRSIIELNSQNHSPAYNVAIRNFRKLISIKNHKK